MAPANRAITAGPNGRVLLFLHGTFSTTQGSFGDLSRPAFFGQLEEQYGDAIYGFDHFSVSQSPERNAQDLLEKLPDANLVYDVVTHSRGKLVLRNLVERKAALRHSARFTLGNAALVACPNEGTPLATPGRWKETVG